MKKLKTEYKYKNSEIVGVIGEEDFKIFDFPRLSNIKVVITKTLNDSYGESYFNVYFIDEHFKIEPLNNLHENIPIENEPKKWEEYIIKSLLEYIIWRDYNYNIAISEVEDNNL